MSKQNGVFCRQQWLMFLFAFVCCLMLSALWMCNGINGNWMFSQTIHSPCNMPLKYLQNRAKEVEGQVFSNDIDCGRILDGDRKYIERRAKQRLQYEEDEQLLELHMECSAIRARRPQFNKDHNSTDCRVEMHVDDLEFPLAFARAIYKDYLFLEMELAVNYQPQNWYCYALDAKSRPDFHKKMRALANCVPNVLLTEREFVMDSAGHNMSNSLVECMHQLTAAEKKWNYLILLQNHDIQLKTNQELVQIFKLFDGANDIQITTVGETNVDWTLRDWSLAHLRLFKNKSKNWFPEGSSGKKGMHRLERGKGQAEASLSRPFVEWITSELNVYPLLAQLNSYGYGVDEYFLPILAGNAFLEAPGGYTLKCKCELTPGITRFTVWLHLFKEHCHSGISRHGSCIFGLEDLASLFKKENNVFLFANKVMPEQDAEAIQCWHEEMMNRTYLHRGLHRLRQEYYSELPQVRYHKEKVENGGVVDMEPFECHYKFLDLVAFGQ